MAVSLVHQNGRNRLVNNFAAFFDSNPTFQLVKFVLIEIPGSVYEMMQQFDISVSKMKEKEVFYGDFRFLISHALFYFSVSSLPVL